MKKGFGRKSRLGNQSKAKKERKKTRSAFHSEWISLSPFQGFAGAVQLPKEARNRSRCHPIQNLLGDTSFRVVIHKVDVFGDILLFGKNGFEEKYSR